MNYKTGQRFTAKIQGTPVEGKILYQDSGNIFLLQNKKPQCRFKSKDMMGYKYAWCMGTGFDLYNYGITDLQILPDTFDKDNWVVDIVKEKDHPRLGEFKEWMNVRNREMKMCDFEFSFRYYGFFNSKVGVLSEHTKNSPYIISLDTFFTHFCKEAGEPKKGDAVEVSGDNVKWYSDKERIYTGFQDEQGWYLVIDKDKDANLWGYIRLAKSPEQVRHEEAEKKADEFLHWYDNNTDPVNRSRRNALTEYIKTKGSICECGSQKDHDSKYCSSCNKFHSI